MTSYLMKCPQTWHPRRQNYRARILKMKNSKQNKIHQENSWPGRLKVKGMLKVLKEHSILEVVRFGFMKTILFVNLSERKGVFFESIDLHCNISLLFTSSFMGRFSSNYRITTSADLPASRSTQPSPNARVFHLLCACTQTKAILCWKKRKKKSS